ncbi:MAG: aldolase/citrate lyase family protein, partial [Pseudomonadota bacterium]|nr:aldolase/citrate lyase family protein [Pseudomonadota bacterium]
MWRSFLFIPVLEDRFIAKAAERGADAIILDLEAGVADDRKVEAREVLGSVVARLSPEVTTTVR